VNARTSSAASCCCAAAASFLILVRVVFTERLSDDWLPQSSRFQQTRGGTLASKDAKQKMIAVNLAMTESLCFSPRAVKYLLGLRTERHVDHSGHTAAAKQRRDSVPKVRSSHGQSHEVTGRQDISVEKPTKKMLRGDRLSAQSATAWRA